MKIKRACVLLFLSSLLCANFPLKADEAFRNHRYDSFKVLPPLRKGDIVFIGNSITHMQNWDEAFGRTLKVKNRGTSGANTQEILDNLESMIDGEPSKVFLMIGTNDLGTEGEQYTPERVAERIIKILKRIKHEVPEAEVYFLSILPSTNGKRTQAKTETTNSLVKEWIDSVQIPTLAYIDLYSLFVAPDGSMKTWVSEGAPFAYSFDNLHLSQQGYRVWMNAIEDKVGLKCVFPEQAPNLFADLKWSPAMRLSSFGVEPTFDSDILLIGNETMHGGAWEELTGSKDFKDRGIGCALPVTSLEHIGSTFKTILHGNREHGVMRQSPRAIVLTGGLSEILWGKAGKQVAQLYIKTFEKLRKEAPGSTIFLTTILPVSSSNDTLKTNIEIANKRIMQYAAKKHLPVIDLHEAMLESNSRNETYFMAPDSPYLSGKGYVRLAREICSVLNQQLGTDYEALTDEEAERNKQRFDLRTRIYNDTLTRQQEEFIVFDNNDSDIPYRIPAIAATKNGDIIAVADYRYSKQDIGVTKDGRLDLRYRIKDHSTGQWGDVLTLASAHGEGDHFVAYGDPCIVANADTEDVIVTSCNGNVSFQNGTHDNHQGWSLFYSPDGGMSWEEPVELAHQVFEQLDEGRYGPIRSFFIGSGKIAQSRLVKKGDYFRLYCAALVIVNDGTYKNFVFYSDDFGRNWRLLGSADISPVPEGGDEAKTEELPNGDILISSRTPGGRYLNIFHFTDGNMANGTWEEAVLSNFDSNGIVASSNPCNGEVLLVPAIRTSDGEETWLLLASVPLGPDGRRNVGINYKELNSPIVYDTAANIAADWHGFYPVTSISSAYSTMTPDKEGHVLFLYERNYHNGGYDIIFKELTLPEITDGKYTALPSTSSPV